MDNTIRKSAYIGTNHLQKILHNRFITESTFVLRLNRDNIQFNAGQYITVGLKDSLQQREYSIYNGEKDDYLEILVREVLNGNISLQLKHCKSGELLEVNGPFGFFKMDTENLYSKKHIFIATGTGIAPFHSFVSSYPGIDYTLIHGVRYKNEAYDKQDYDPGRYILCTSREKNGNYYGRVTKFLLTYPVESDMLFYLCGNSNMIYEVYDILRKRKVSTENIHSEVYF